MNILGLSASKILPSFLLIYWPGDISVVNLDNELKEDRKVKVFKFIQNLGDLCNLLGSWVERVLLWFLLQHNPLHLLQLYLLYWIRSRDPWSEWLCQHPRNAFQISYFYVLPTMRLRNRTVPARNLNIWHPSDEDGFLWLDIDSATTWNIQHPWKDESSRRFCGELPTDRLDSLHFVGGRSLWKWSHAKPQKKRSS